MDSKFNDLLKKFRNDVDKALSAYYTRKIIRKMINEDPELLNLLNNNYFFGVLIKAIYPQAIIIITGT